MTRCSKCGREVVASGCGTGYAILPDESRVCYACADEMQRETMRSADKIPAYVAGDGKAITTWSGGVLAKVTRETKSRTGWRGSEITHVRAVAPDGSTWHGKGAGRGMFINLRRSKSVRNS